MIGSAPPPGGSAAGREGAGTASDTVADDCAEAFLEELDDVLWLLHESERGEGRDFRHAVRKADHLTEFRRLLYRLHKVLARWEAEATAGA